LLTAVLLVLLCAGFVWQTSENEWGHAVIGTALSVVDDTALTGKLILGELKVCASAPVAGTRKNSFSRREG
jgi:hypothetical protein